MKSRISPGEGWKKFPGRRAAILAVFCACVFFPDGNVQASPPGVLVWHFDQGIANRWGGVYNVFALEPSGARTYLDSSVHRPDAKHSLRVASHREPEGFCGVWLEFYPSSATGQRYLDVSVFRYLSLWIRGKIAGGSFDITLEDENAQRHLGQNSMVSLRSYLPAGPTDEWQEVNLPLQDFPHLNLRRLVRLSLSFTSPGNSRFNIDDISFKAERSGVLPLPRSSTQIRRSALLNSRRSLWVWNTSEILANQEQADRFFNFCSRAGVNQLYLSFGFDPSPTSAGVHFAVRDPDCYRNFVGRAHRLGMIVEALAGSPEWAARRNHASALAAVGAVMEFNRTSPKTARFDGIHFDVEPYSLLGYADAAHARELLVDFLRMISLCARRTHAQAGLRFTCDVPAYFFSATGIEAQQFLVKFRGSEKTVGEHLVGLVDDATIMDYHNQADGAGGVIAGALPALRQAAMHGRKVRVGIETSIEPETTVYFVCGLPREEFRRRLASSHLEDELSSQGWRLLTFSDEINIHVGLAAPSDLQSAERRALNAALVHLGRLFGAASDGLASAPNLDEARAAMEHGSEWTAFEPFELDDPETRRTIHGFKALHRMAAKSTFHGLGLEIFEEETRSIDEWLSPVSSYGGLAIHHYQSYRDLLEGK